MTKNKSRPSVMLATMILWAGIVQAQESVNTSGSNASGSGGSVAYSIGQVSYITEKGVTGSVAQGVQHAFEIYVVGIEETDLDITLTVFPNPTTHHLILQIGGYSNEKLSYQLVDMQGKLLKIGQITDSQTQIQMDGLPCAAYLISVINQDKNIQSFIIIKN